MAEFIGNRDTKLASIEVTLDEDNPKSVLNIRVSTFVVESDEKGEEIRRRHEVVDFHPDKVPALKAAVEQLVADGMIVDPNTRPKEEAVF